MGDWCYWCYCCVDRDEYGFVYLRWLKIVLPIALRSHLVLVDSFSPQDHCFSSPHNLINHPSYRLYLCMRRNPSHAPFHPFRAQTHPPNQPQPSSSPPPNPTTSTSASRSQARLPPVHLITGHLPAQASPPFLHLIPFHRTPPQLFQHQSSTPSLSHAASTRHGLASLIRAATSPPRTKGRPISSTTATVSK